METFNKLILANAYKSFPLKTPRGAKQCKPKTPRPAKWFSSECHKAKNKYKRAMNKIRRDPFDVNLQQLLTSARKGYKTTCRKAEANLRKDMLAKLLAMNDPKQFWKLIKNMREWGQERQDPSNSISPDKWKDYFKTFLNSPKDQQLEIPKEHNLFAPETDSTICINELKAAINRAKPGKACGPDDILIEYIKYATDNVVNTLLDQVNAIFCHATYPKQWAITTSKPYTKKDQKMTQTTIGVLLLGQPLASCIA